MWILRTGPFDRTITRSPATDAVDGAISRLRDKPGGDAALVAHYPWFLDRDSSVESDIVVIF